MELEGKVALITGGSMGIGTAISLNMAQNGADVALTYRRHEQQASRPEGHVQLHPGCLPGFQGAAVWKNREHHLH